MACTTDCEALKGAISCKKVVVMIQAAVRPSSAAGGTGSDGGGRHHGGQSGRCSSSSPCRGRGCSGRGRSPNSCSSACSCRTCSTSRCTGASRCRTPASPQPPPPSYLISHKIIHEIHTKHEPNAQMFLEKFMHLGEILTYSRWWGGLPGTMTMGQASSCPSSPLLLPTLISITFLVRYVIWLDVLETKVEWYLYTKEEERIRTWRGKGSVNSVKRKSAKNDPVFRFQSTGTGPEILYISPRNVSQ